MNQLPHKGLEIALRTVEWKGRKSQRHLGINILTLEKTNIQRHLDETLLWKTFEWYKPD